MSLTYYEAISHRSIGQAADFEMFGKGVHECVG